MKKIIIILSVISFVFSFEQQIGQLNEFDVSMNKIVLKMSSEIAPKLGEEMPLTAEFLPGLEAYTGEFRNYNFYPLFITYLLLFLFKKSSSNLLFILHLLFLIFTYFFSYH